MLQIDTRATKDRMSIAAAPSGLSSRSRFRLAWIDLMTPVLSHKPNCSSVAIIVARAVQRVKPSSNERNREPMNADMMNRNQLRVAPAMSLARAREKASSLCLASFLLFF